jgi:3-deoxy-D-manno-octulosonic-acid transferase
MYFIYTMMLGFALIIAFPYYLIRFRKYLPTLSDRLGFLQVPQLQNAIWIHAVSVGEVKAVERLLERLRQESPRRSLVVSTATPAGQELARQRHDIIDYTFYFPIDFPWCVKKALDRIDPQTVIIAETEIWPNFLRACRGRGTRVVMINGRISDKSFARYRLVKRWLRKVFEDYTIIGMQSDMDRRRIEAIGANPQKVTVFGNLKYDVVGTNRPVEPALAAVLQSWKQIWIAASTMPGEEDFVLNAYAELRASHPQLKLVIAPRHASRFDAVEEMVKRRQIACSLRTRLNERSECKPDAKRKRDSAQPQHRAQPVWNGAADVLILDTFGELASVFQYATVVFMGGSLVPKGGHNLLEPAMHRKPIVFGPHMENFRDMARLFLDANGGVQIHDSAELASATRELLSNESKALELGRNAQRIVHQNTGATDRVLQFLQPQAAEASR